MQEYKRVLTKKTMLIILLLLLLNIGIFSKINFTSENINNSKVLIECENLSIDEAITKIIGIIDDINNGVIDDDVSMYIQDRKDLVSLNSYKDNIQLVFDNAENMKRFSKFNKENSFSLNNINKTVKDYKKISDLELNIVNGIAIDAIIQYQYMGYITCIIGIIIIFNILLENDTGMDNLVYTYKNGRRKLGFKRIRMLFVIESVILLIMYISIILLSNVVLGGFSKLDSPIQCISSCRDFTYRLNIGEYLCLNYIGQLIVVYAVSMVIYMICKLIENRKMSICGVCIFLGIEFVLYNRIDEKNVYGFLKRYNVINVFDYCKNVLCTYKNSKLLNYAVSFKILLICVLIIAIIIASIVIIYKSMSYKASKKSIISERIVRCNQRILSYIPSSLYEVYKIMISSKGIIITIVIVMINFMLFDYFRTVYGANNQYVDELYVEYGGSDYTYFENYVEDYYLEKDTMEAELNEYSLLLQEDPDNEDVYIEYNMMNYSYATFVKTKGKICEEYESKLEHLRELKDKENIVGYIMPERGYNAIFGEKSIKKVMPVMIITLIGISMILLDSFDMEIKSKMSEIIICCKNGRGKYFKKKVLINVLSALVVIAITIICELIDNGNKYGYYYIDAPVRSLMFQSTMLNCSVRVWLIIVYGLRITYMLSILTSVLMLPLVCRDKNIRNIMSIVYVMCIILAIVYSISTITIQALLTIIALIIAIYMLHRGFAKWCNA